MSLGLRAAVDGAGAQREMAATGSSLHLNDLNSCSSWPKPPVIGENIKKGLIALGPAFGILGKGLGKRSEDDSRTVDRTGEWSALETSWVASSCIGSRRRGLDKSGRDNAGRGRLEPCLVAIFGVRPLVVLSGLILKPAEGGETGEGEDLKVVRLA